MTKKLHSNLIPRADSLDLPSPPLVLTSIEPKQIKASTKLAAVVAQLERDSGATVAELMSATGWLPHTTRAALTGIRKRGLLVERFKRDEATCYRITGKA